ncbi:sugar phosphate isomerase/epimerase family protein [Roseiconus lacunae]|uniref:Sugar phosphate isomerase/epimerase family protein n=1 Tax=Roseiconus lacunae TaxID=2605694 RepID=A0ABT7PJG6_9BACT|nr:sugar phosphate isomerase/epimerase family protein [Roseiconus lacunae]MCD0461740.1 sugar phosphate isomerase/epimerase [Roseiconus lacunae]MDM4016615.1 sugar phosphate isomerase/epimerase family protein [Roseiconus lacunae]
MTVKYGICNETFGDMELSEALQIAKAAGYTGWEVAPFMLTDDVDSFTAEQRKAYRDEVTNAGLQIIGLHWLLAKTEGFHLTTLDEAVRDETSKYLSKLAKLCGDLGGDVMVLGSPQQRNFPSSQTPEEAMASAADCLRGVVPTLQEQGVRIAIEPLGRGEGNFLNTAAEGRELMRMVDSEHVQLHLDVKAMSDEPTEITQIIRDNADAMIHFHANDPNLKGPGMGDVDFVPIFKTLSEVGYDGWVSVEVFDYAMGAEAIANESMRNMLQAQK